MNSWHVQQLKFAFGIGGFMSFYGIVGLIVWLLGDKMGFPIGQRIVVIALILLTMPFVLLLGYVVSRRSKKKEEAAKKEEEAKKEAKADEKADGAPQAKLATPTGTYDDLPKGAEETVNFLKSSNLGENNGKDAVYSLPWYIIAGAPKTGKSSLVMGSNLNFQTLPSQRQSEQKIIRPTRGIDWRVTSDAVFVDTAGRYNVEGSDQDEWASLLETIKKYRGNRPIDGFLMIADTEKILNSDERQIEEMAKVLRTRLDEAIQRLKVRFPVYLIFTHADSIEGFRDSFSTSKKEGQNLVWGATIPLEKSENAHSLFDEEYELLHNSVMKRRLMRLSAPFPPVRQLRIFNFPLHFGSARRKIGAFVATVFRPNPFSQNPFLRGFYFTAVPVSRSAPLQGDKTMESAPAQTVGTTYFTEKFFRDVLLRDKDLVKTFIEQRQKPPIFGWLMTILGTFLILALLILAGVSLASNKQMLDDAQQRANAVLTIVKADRANANRNPLDKNPAETQNEIETIEKLRSIMVKLDNYDRSDPSPPLYMRFGLYSGERLYKEKLLNIYFNAIGRRYMDPTAKRIKADLKKFADGQGVINANQLTQTEEDALGKNYDLLKAYLMLTAKYKDKANPSDIANALKDYWISESKVPQNLQDDAHRQLEFYAKQVDRPEFPPIEFDDTLVAAVRSKLKAFPAYQRYYKAKATQISKDVEKNFDVMSVDKIIARNGGDSGLIEGTFVVPGAYTLEGYRLMKQAIEKFDTSAEDWVMGEEGKNASAQATDAAKIEERYFRDYTDYWRKFIENTRIKSYTKETAKESLASFSSSSSPLKVLLFEIEKNTNFSAKPKSGGWWQSIKDTVNGWFEKKISTDTGGNSEVEKQFGPLFDFLEQKGDGKEAKSKYDEYQTDIGIVYNRWNLFTPNKINDLAGMSEEDRNKADNFPQLKIVSGKIDTYVKPFQGKPATQPLVDLLSQPIGNLSALLGAGTKTQIAQKWGDILKLAQNAEKGYPFEPDSSTPADFANLKEYLAPGKGLSKFYEESLKRYFDGSPGELKLKTPSEVQFTPEFVDYLNKALVLRQALFGSGDSVKFDYNFELLNAKDALVEITIDGITISSIDKPSSPISFPATTGGGNGVIIKILSTGGTTSTSGTTNSANTSSTSVNTSNSSTNTKFLQNNNNNNSSPDEKSFLGPWGLFKFLDASDTKKQSDNSYSISYKLKSGKILSVKITPTGIDPFNKEIYKLRAPETILKQ